jgi:chemotaxis family two-component system response regulator Rcp1
VPIEILLVEDNLGDVRLTKEAFRATNKLIYIHTVSDGVQAMAFLSQKGAFAHAPRPDLIMLDLSLPVMDGRELLSLIKKDERTCSIPIVVVTGSENEKDEAISFSNGADGYHKKPVRWEAFEALVKQMNDFWIHQVDVHP